MNDILSSLLLGLIEGITEFLPVSSTGHLLIAEHWLGKRSDLFNIAIQAGAILAVVLIYRARLVELVLGLREPRNRIYSMKLALAFGVTAALGLIVKKLGVELPETVAPVAWALLLGGIVMLGAEALAARRGGDADGAGGDRDNVSWKVAALVGVAQVVAGVFPGTSRAAAAIFAALLFGRGSRVAATEFAFLVGIPTMFAATGYELLHVLKNGGAAGEDWAGLGIALVVSAITAFVAVKWLLGYIQTHRFTVFAWYRIVLGVALLASLASAPATSAATGSAPAAGPSTTSSRAVGAEEASGASTAPGARVDAPSGPMRPRSYDAASSTAPAAFAHMRQCLWDATLRRMYAYPGFAGMQAHALGGATPEQRASAQAHGVAERARLERDRAECQADEGRTEDGSAIRLALEAANAGDRDAAFCFAAADLPMPHRMRDDPATFQAYRVNARRFVDAGVASGEWRMVHIAQVMYGGPPSHNEGNDVDVPHVGPGYAWMRRVLPAADPERSYGLAVLESLASPAAVEPGPERVLVYLRDQLDQTQAARAEGWARALFNGPFGGKANTGPYEVLCLQGLPPTD